MIKKITRKTNGFQCIKKTFVLFTFFIFLLSDSQGRFSEDEINQAWTETGYSFETLTKELTMESCYKSEITFSACLMAFHELLARAIKNESYQLKVSDLNALEIVPFSIPNQPTLKEFRSFQTKQRESFRLLFRTQPPGIGEFESIVQQVLKFARKIPRQEQSKMAGYTYNTYLRETIDPISSLKPQKLLLPISNKNAIGIGAYLDFYKTDNGETTWAVNPLKGSHAKKSGLRRGDLILAIDDFNISKLPVDSQTESDLIRRIRGPIGSRVKLKILSICNNRKKEITVARQYVDHPIYDWMANNHFLDLDQPQSLDCESEEPSDESQQIPENSSESDAAKPQALYMPLKSFNPPLISPVNMGIIWSLTTHFPMIIYFPLCAEFIDLQNKDLRNPNSFGMIIDLRNNMGGNFFETVCMLNSIIQSRELLTTFLSIEEGRVSTSHENNIHYHFTDGGIPLHTRSSPTTYNRNIVVIINKLSGSASELFAGTIQEMKRGWVVGDRSYGKGSAQYTEPINLTPESDKATENPLKPLTLGITKRIFTLNSGRSPQGYGIIPDFRFSQTGEPIEEKADYISYLDQVFFNNIQFENSPWEQNRPEEWGRLNDCINEEGRLGQILKEKIRKDEKYRHTLAVDYQLELAKDILMCSQSSSRPSVIPAERLLPPYP